MAPAVYYNEWDKGAAAWLRELIRQKLIPFGYVDERSITEVTPSDLEGFTQCHFFAGIGGWSLAFRLAGIPDTFPLWSGSPPCQPFSVAGAGAGKGDARHLAPAFLDLVAERRPQFIFGEQVAAAITKDQWADSLLIELAEEGYASGFTVLPACSVGAPHKRDRLFFGAQLAESVRSEWNSEQLHGLGESDQAQEGGETAELTGRGDIVVMGNTNGSGSQVRCFQSGKLTIPQGREASKRPGGLPSLSCRLADSGNCSQQRGESRTVERGLSQGACEDAAIWPVSPNSFWSDADWLGCRDGKFRPVEPGTFPLANGIPARVGRLRGYGNAIVPQVAAEFVKAFMQSCPCEFD